MSAKPSIIILHGDDTFGFQRAIDAMIAKMGDPGLADLNISRLDGREASEDAIYSAANAMPFLVERRLVLLSNPFSRMKSEPARVRFRELLDRLPETTALVLVIDDEIERKDWKTLHKTHWLRRWMDDAGGKRVYYQLCQLPNQRQMVEWIRNEAKNQGGQILPDAASALAEHIGNDTRAASLEIDKLLTYVMRSRPVEVLDVEELSAQEGQADIFAMIDAIAAGNASVALNLLHRLLEEQDEMSLFGMIARQFRQLIQAREILDEGKGVRGVMQEIINYESLAQKLADHAGRFSMARLEAIYHRLLEIDGGMKTGQHEMTVALDIFIADLAR